MNGYAAVRAIAEREGLSLYSISRQMGKNVNYLSNAASRGASPSCSTLSDALSHCGWKLVALPGYAVPDSAIEVD